MTAPPVLPARPGPRFRGAALVRTARLGLRRWAGGAAVGAVVMGAVVLLPAAPAYAFPIQPNIAISSATSGGISGDASFTPDIGYSGGIVDIAIVVTFNGQTVSSCDQCGTGANTAFGFTPSGLGANGPYSVRATASASESLIGTGLSPQSTSNSTSARFSVAVPPASPIVSTVVNADGSVTVSWGRNTEPDLIGYQVRRDSGSGLQTVVPFHAQPRSGAGVSWTDTTTNQGGSFRYVVYAIRPGSDGSANTALSSSSNAATASVPVPPPPSTTVPAGGGVVPAVTTTTAVASAPKTGSSSPDLSAFLNQANNAGAVTHAPAAASSSPPTQLVIPSAPAGPPDTYQPTLPFGRVGPANAAPGAAGTPRIALPDRTGGSGKHHQGGLLYSIAGGLLLCVLGLAMRSANKASALPPLQPVTELDRAGGAGPVGGVDRPGGGGGAAGRVVPASVAAKANARVAARAGVGEALGSPPPEGGVDGQPATGVAEGPIRAPRSLEPASARPVARRPVRAPGGRLGASRRVGGFDESTASAGGSTGTKAPLLAPGTPTRPARTSGAGWGASGQASGEGRGGSAGRAGNGTWFGPRDPVADGLSHLAPLIGDGRGDGGDHPLSGDESGDYFGLIRGLREPVPAEFRSQSVVGTTTSHHQIGG